MAGSMGIRNTKNVQSSVSSNVFVGLKAETFHAIDMHAKNFFSDDGINVFKELRELKEELEILKEEIQKKTTVSVLKDLSDVNLDGVSEGDTLVYTNEQWKAGSV
jgi:hypothetical protein